MANSKIPCREERPLFRGTGIPAYRVAVPRTNLRPPVLSASWHLRCATLQWKQSMSDRTYGPPRTTRPLLQTAVLDDLGVAALRAALRT